MKMQFMQQIVQGNPKYQEALQGAERFQALLENYGKNLHPSCRRVCGGVGQLTFYLLWLKFPGPRRHGVKRTL
ncbi:MAG TPA: hypothetical protein EYG44_05980, partial [Verrucomicrobia bacterium]|nr:hypothetical protein [Verrucomicrobiota bacterium]